MRTLLWLVWLAGCLGLVSGCALIEKIVPTDRRSESQPVTTVSTYVELLDPLIEKNGLSTLAIPLRTFTAFHHPAHATAFVLQPLTKETPHLPQVITEYVGQMPLRLNSRIELNDWSETDLRFGCTEKKRGG